MLGSGNICMSSPDEGCTESSSRANDSGATRWHSSCKDEIVSWNSLHKVKPRIRTSIKSVILSLRLVSLISKSRSVWVLERLGHSVEATLSISFWDFLLDQCFIFLDNSVALTVGVWMVVAAIEGFWVIVGSIVEVVVVLSVTMGAWTSVAINFSDLVLLFGKVDIKIEDLLLGSG